MSESGLHTQDPQREQMLGSLLRSLDARRRRRRATRGLALVVLAVLGVQLIRPGIPGSAPMSLPELGAGQPSLYAVQRLATRDLAPAAVVRDEPTTLIQYIDDEQLLASLNEKSDCYGLLRRGTHVALLDRCAP